jgi:hypothetical protein
MLLLALASAPSAVPVAVVCASFLLVSTGIGKKQLTSRLQRCPVCRRDRRRCTCRWL